MAVLSWILPSASNSPAFARFRTPTEGANSSKGVGIRQIPALSLAHRLCMIGHCELELINIRPRGEMKCNAQPFALILVSA